VKPGTYFVYPDQRVFPSFLNYPSEPCCVGVAEGATTKFTITLNYSSQQQNLSSQGVSVWLTRVDDPNATHLRWIHTTDKVYIWIQGPVGDNSEFQIFTGHDPSTETFLPLGRAIRLDPSGKPVCLEAGFGGTPGERWIDVRMQGSTMARVIVYLS
jgi:hypothetical protein